MIVSKRVISLSTVAVAALLFMGAGSAAADEGDVHNAPEKAAYIPQVQVPGTSNSTLQVLRSPSKGEASTNATWTHSGKIWAEQGMTVDPPGGQRGGIMASFQSDAESLNVGTFWRVNGWSYAQWSGMVPYAPTTLTLTDKIWAGGIAPTVSAGPVGAGMYTTGSEWGYTSTHANEFHVTHHYSGLEFSGLIVTINQNATVAAVFGTASFIHTTN